MRWISVEEEKLPIGECLVYLESELCNSRVHSANFYENGLNIVGNVFQWDAPKVTHWMKSPLAIDDERKYKALLAVELCKTLTDLGWTYSDSIGDIESWVRNEQREYFEND